jgi:hypothetical protein
MAIISIETFMDVSFKVAVGGSGKTCWPDPALAPMSAGHGMQSVQRRLRVDCIGGGAHDD